MWDLTLPTHNIEAHTNTLTQNTLTHKQSHTNSTQQAYHHSPSSHNQNNLAKKRGVEASKQDPGKDNIADLLPTQPIVFWWFIIIWRQKEINQTFPLVFLIIVIIIIILISMISILVTTIAIIIMIIIIIITWYRRRWHQSQIWRFRICTCGEKILYLLKEDFAISLFGNMIRRDGKYIWTTNTERSPCRPHHQ